MAKTRTHTILLQPVGAELKAPAGASLRDLLFEQGVEFPCGGQGRCRGCKVRVLQGHAEINAAQQERLTAAEIAEGWRLACQCHLEDDLVIELRQWDAAILSNEEAFAFTPQEGLGVAVDLGTTTLVAQLLDLETGHVLGVRTALNPQARHGADLMSRVQFAVSEGGQRELEGLIRKQIGTLIHQLLTAARVEDNRLRKVVLVGNTVMHHLFCGISVEPLSHYPFESVHDGLQTFVARDLGWALNSNPTVQFLPCLGSFVGSDILAGVLATGLCTSEALVGLIDLGTNGEIVLGNRERLICASTAAGPAFEGARISSGMRAATGAIWKVTAYDGRINCEVLGNVPPRGVCGSGLVDAVAASLELGRIKPSGQLANGRDTLPLCPPVSLTQMDVRQLQLAKGAIAAGIRILLQWWGAAPEDVTRLYLAGAFGNYINLTSARRIGLLDFPEENIQPSGNTALLGAKLALFSSDGEDGSYTPLRTATEHVSLSADPRFQEIFVEEMSFPQA
ncbi:MAG: DUF4445 domain-containing protein [Armatimonadetes bacterium]|nr:DUF4445 domain-containing protein [Armatimonadota bacterium]